MTIPFEDAEAWRINEGYESMTQINTGGCENFAMAMLRHIPDGEVVGTENFVCWDHTEHWIGGHCWIVDNIKHYDSETLDGVDDWRLLPFFKSRLTEVREVLCECQQISYAKKETH